MKVILLSDVVKVGKKYDLVDVAPGFARNFLFAKGLAEAVTKSSAKRVAQMQEKRQLEKKNQEAKLENAFEAIKKSVITVKRSANEEGHLYAGVSADELALLLGKMVGVTISGEHIIIEKPFKNIGTFTVAVVLNGKKVDFKLVIEAETEAE